MEKKKTRETKTREQKDASRRLQVPGGVSAFEDSVVSQADKGKKIGNVEGMRMKGCIYRFVLGQLATLTEFSHSVKHMCHLAQDHHSVVPVSGLKRKENDTQCASYQSQNTHKLLYTASSIRHH